MPVPTHRHWRPVLTLLLITPLLTELLSNNLTFSMILQPVTLLFLSTVGYGFPVLLIRELAVRRGYGLAQLALLGLSFGLWNEGVLAKTLLRAYDIPIDLFDFYGITFHIAIPWAFLICTWHAMHAVIYPIFIVYFFFPSQRDEPWLSRRGSVIICLITLVLGLLIFFSHSPENSPGGWPQLLVFAGIAAVLALFAERLPLAPRIIPGGAFQWAAIRHGFCFFILCFFVPLVLARMRIPVVLYALYFIVLIGVCLFFLCRKRKLAEIPFLLFMLGDQVCLAAFTLIGACGMYSYERMAASLIFLAIFLGSIGWLRRSSVRST
jgi:hypothetical protein